jgi:hypothetical protein
MLDLENKLKTFLTPQFEKQIHTVDVYKVFFFLQVIVGLSLNPVFGIF